MNTIKKILGKILYGITKLIELILDGLIWLVDTIVTIVKSIASGFIALIGLGGCLLLFMLFGPFTFAILLHPVILLIILFFAVFPILGTKFVSYLKYIKYIITEFLFDRANYLIDGIDYQFESFSEYKDKYRKMEEERKRREYQQRQSEQQRQWEERFRQWYEYQNSQRSNGWDNYEWYGKNTSYNTGQNYVNPAIEFKSKYEKSCDILGVSYDADKYEIKLAYRKKAKEYHPDINKSPNATEMFQKINNAYEFLSDGNIERYQNLR